VHDGLYLTCTPRPRRAFQPPAARALSNRRRALFARHPGSTAWTNDAEPNLVSIFRNIVLLNYWVELLKYCIIELQHQLGIIEFCTASAIRTTATTRFSDAQESAGDHAFVASGIPPKESACPAHHDGPATKRPRKSAGLTGPHAHAEAADAHGAASGSSSDDDHPHLTDPQVDMLTVELKNTWIQSSERLKQSEELERQLQECLDQLLLLQGTEQECLELRDELTRANEALMLLCKRRAYFQWHSRDGGVSVEVGSGRGVGTSKSKAKAKAKKARGPLSDAEQAAAAKKALWLVQRHGN
jgi:hypothetical protein